MTAVERGVGMRTRDGVELVSDVYRPEGPGPFPVLLMRTPYGRGEVARAADASEALFFTRHGYLVVAQDVRGRGDSGGSFYPYLREGEDGYDAVEWAARLPGSDGQVAMTGQSYLAGAQYSTAVLAPPHLRAASPIAGPARLFGTALFRQGAFDLRYRLAYFLAMERASYHRAGRYRAERARLNSYVRNPAEPLSLLTDDAYRHLPLRDWAERLRGGEPYLADFFEHWAPGEFWAGTDNVARAGRVRIPMLHIGSWYDVFQADTLAMFAGIRAHAAQPETRAGQRLIMGPWGHLHPFIRPTTGGAGDIDFGPAAAVRLLDFQLEFFDHVIKGVRPAGETPAVRLFVMGDNTWRDEREWPLARAAELSLYLRGGGALSGVPPADEPGDRYVYRPDDPVPTLGGNVVGADAGVSDQRPVERRADVLVYTGEVLRDPLEVTGPVSVELYAASSAPDTDFVARLVDVHPDGFAQNIADGIVRTRFRDGSRPPAPSPPGTVRCYLIDLWSTSHVFGPGHRVRLDVTSSNFPRYDRNANSGLPLGDDVVLHDATQTVFHDARRASRVVLPVIPR